MYKKKESKNLKVEENLFPSMCCPLLSQVLNLQVLDDDIPEFAEHFQVTLVSAVSGDGKQGSTPTSGASIDPENSSTNIIIKASDHPNGKSLGHNTTGFA